MKVPPFTQIFAIPSEDGGVLYGLDQNGRVWVSRMGSNSGWKRYQLEVDVASEKFI